MYDFRTFLCADVVNIRAGLSDSQIENAGSIPVARSKRIFIEKTMNAGTFS